MDLKENIADNLMTYWKDGVADGGKIYIKALGEAIEVLEKNGQSSEEILDCIKVLCAHPNLLTMNLPPTR